MTLRPGPPGFPYIYEENFVFFYQCTVRFAPAQMVVDVLTEERDGVKKERDGEEGRFARLVTSLVETLHIDLGDFNGRWNGK
jgi:hypothetical protein